MTDSLAGSRVFELTRQIAELKLRLHESFRKEHRRRLAEERAYTEQLRLRLSFFALSETPIAIPSWYWEAGEKELVVQQRRNSEYADFMRLKIRTNPATFPDKRRLLEEYDVFDGETANVLAQIDRTIAVARERLRQRDQQRLQTGQRVLQWEIEHRDSQRQLTRLRATAQSWKQKSEDLTRQLVQIHGSVSLFGTDRDCNGRQEKETAEVACLRRAIEGEMDRSKHLYVQLRYMVKQRRLFEAKLKTTVLELKHIQFGLAETEMQSTAREFASLFGRNQALYALVEDLQTLNKIRDIDHAVAFIINAICKSVEADRASYWICDPVKNLAWTKKGTHNSAGMETLVIPLSTGLAGACFHAKQTINVEDAYLDPRFNRTVDLKTGYRTTAVMCVPILGPDGVTVVGVAQAINKISAVAGKFDQDDAHRLSVLGYAMRNVLGSCQTHEEHEKNIRRRDAIIDKAEDILKRAGSKKDLINLVVEKNAEIWRATANAIWIVYKDFMTRVAVDREGGVVSYDQPIEAGLVGKVVASRKPVHANFPVEDAGFDPNVDIELHQTGRLHTWPIFHPRDEKNQGPVVCVVQWATVGKSAVTFGDNGSFNEHYTAHVHLAELFLGRIVGNFVDTLWPWKWRKLWTKSKRQKLKVRSLVSLEPPEGPDAHRVIACISIQRWFREGYTVSALASLFTYSLKRRR